MGGTCFPFFICAVWIWEISCSSLFPLILTTPLTWPFHTSIPTIFGVSTTSWMLSPEVIAQILDLSYAYHPTAKQRHSNKTSSKSRLANFFTFCLMVVMGIPRRHDSQIGATAIHFKRKSSAHNTFMKTPINVVKLEFLHNKLTCLSEINSNEKLKRVYPLFASCYPSLRRCFGGICDS